MQPKRTGILVPTNIKTINFVYTCLKYDAGGAACGDENCGLGSSTERGFDDVMAEMKAMA